MRDDLHPKANLFVRSLSLQGILLIVGITVLMVGSSSWVSMHFASNAMLQRMSETSTEKIGLLRLIIDKPMLIGDDASTTREFEFLSAHFPQTDISIASFNNNVTYSTTPGDIRQDISQLFTSSMASDDLALFQSAYKSALKGDLPEGALLSIKGERNYLQVTPILNQKECHHCHGSTQPVLGAMAVLDNVEQQLSAAEHSNLRNILVSTLGGLFLVFGIYMFIKKRIINRLDSLAGTSDQILEGNYNARFTVTGQDELGRMASNLGDMLQSLKQLGIAQSVVQGMSIPSAMCDTQGKLTFVNQSLLDLLEEKTPADKLLGTSLNILLYGKENAASAFMTVLASKVPCTDCEESILSRSGRCLFVRFDASPVLDLEGNLWGAFSSVSDLTAIRTNEAAIMDKSATIRKTAQEAGVLTEQIARAANSLGGQIETTREQASHQLELSDRTESELAEINTALAEVARNAGQVAAHAGDTKESAIQGARQAEDVSKSMTTMTASIGSLKTQMEELGHKTANIDQVMQVIQDIADQTNLLALNAAIEAARAGDAGRGFAVVADEVRKLAEKTMKATVEVGGTISELRASAEMNIKAVEQTSEDVIQSAQGVRLTGESLGRILALAESVAAEVHSIAVAAEQQSASTEAVRDSIYQMKLISQDARTATAESETVARSLIGIADSLNDIVAGMNGKEN